MKVTFPHMGTAHLAFGTLLADLGLEPVVPPRTSQRTLALGVKYAPEFACFPLKVNLGNYLEAFAAGAEAIERPASRQRRRCRTPSAAVVRAIEELPGIS